jgi:ribonucleoside-diphosphate reductase beta chain
MTKFNPNNKGHENGYRLFLGEELGLADTVNVQYPQLERFYEQQESFNWGFAEVGLMQDKVDMLHAPTASIDMMTETISWQFLVDSVAGRSISSIIGRWVTNPELEYLYGLINMFEGIHARTYSHIIKNVFEFPQDVIDKTYANAQVLARSEVIVEAFDNLAAVSDDAPVREKEEALIVALVALLGLEAIAFTASFAVTFGIAETGIFQGISQLVTLICRDEMLHARVGAEVIRILRDKEGMGIALALATPKIKKLLDTIVENELAWAEHIFKDHQIVGLNEKLLKKYVQFLARPVYMLLDVPFDFEIVEDNPLMYMDKYIDSRNIQVAPQELQITAYKVNSVIDDTAGIDFTKNLGIKAL